MLCLPARLLLCGAATWALALAPVPSAAPAEVIAPSYSFQLLGPLGGAGSKACAVSDSGEIVGTADTGLANGLGEPIFHAMLWSPPGYQPQDLGTLGGDNSWACGINRREEVIGQSETLPNDNDALTVHPFYWSASAGMSDIGSWDNPPATYARVNAINDRGDIVGGRSVGGSAESAAVWVRHRPHTLSGARQEAEGIAIDNRGEVAGNQAIYECTAAIRWSSLDVRGRTLVPGYHCEPLSNATAMNGLGEITGVWGANAFIWRAGQFRKLPRPGGAFGFPTGINNRDEVVGQYFILPATWPGRASLWVDDHLYDLNLPAHPPYGWSITTASAINNRGQIIGCATNGTTGEVRGYLLTPGALHPW